MGQANYTIREYRPDDREQIVSIGQQVIATRTTFPFEEIAGVVDYWFSPQGRVYVAASGPRVLGTYVIKPNLPGRGNHIANAGYMVDTQARGQGVGRALGEHSLVIGRQLGYAAMQFNHVVATNDHAMQLWQSLGFRVVGRVPESFRHPELGLVETCILYRELATA